MIFPFQKSAFTTEKDRQVAHMLSMLIFVSWASYLVVLIIGISIGERTMVAVSAVGSVMLSAPFLLLYRRHLFAACWLLSLEVLATLTLLATFGQGYRDIALFAFPVILIFTSMTLSRSIFLINTGLMLTSLGWLVFGQMNGWFVPVPIPPGNYWVNFLLITSILLFSAYSIDLLVRNMRKNFERAQNELDRRKEAEVALRESEERYRQLFAASPDGIILIGPDGCIADANYAQARMYRYDSSKDLIGMHATELVAPTCRAHSVQIMQRRLKGEHIPPIEYEVIRRDGTTFFGEVSATILQSNNSPVAGYICITRDTTERKQAQEALQESRNRLELAATSAQLGIWDWDIISNKMLWDDQMFHLYGIAAKPARYGPELWQNGLHPDDADLAWEACQAALRGEKNYDIEFRVRHPDGQIRHIKADGIVVRDGTGKPVRMIGVNHDISERKQAEGALRASEERFRMLFESTSIALNITCGTEIIYANPSYLRMFGYSNVAELKQIAPLDLFAPEVRSKIMENIRQRAKGLPVPDNYESECIRKDGTRFPVLMYFTKTLFSDGPATVGFILDITERKRMEEELQKVQKLDSLGVLAGGIAHDFNNLLGGIFGYINMARENSTADKTVSKYLDKALTVFERAKALTQQLLTFSKGGAPKRKTGDLGTLVRENAAFVLSGTNVSCEYSIASDLWPCDFDENQIGQVVDNIVINAQQAMPLGGTIAISVNNISLHDGENSALKGGLYNKVSITDTGVGIPQDLLKRIFDPFFTTKQKGNGLGLTTCYSIIQKHEGCIDIESIPGKGSTFHVFLPASLNVIARDDSELSSQHKGSGTILILDDEDFMREIVGCMLTDMGYGKIEAGDGKVALELCDNALLQGSPILAALFDLTIPGGMGGREAIIVLREKFPDMPVFASSGFSEDPVMARPTEFGFTDSIRKPFKKSDLADMLGRHLKNL